MIRRISRSRNALKNFSTGIFRVVLLVVLNLVTISPAKADTSSCTPGPDFLSCILQKDVVLRDQNRKLSTVYAKRDASLGKPEKEALKHDQENWLRIRAAACSLSQKGNISRDEYSAAESCLENLYKQRVLVLGQKCELDEGFTVEQMLTWQNQWSDKIPSGYVIDPRSISYILNPEKLETARISLYSLPSTKATPVASIGGDDVFLAVCRVQATDGAWWLVNQMRDGKFSYILQSDSAEKR